MNVREKVETLQQLFNEFSPAEKDKIVEILILSLELTRLSGPE